MRALIFLLISAVMLPSAAFAQWREFFAPEEHFSVNVPAEPEVREFEFATESATLPAKVFTVVDGDQLYSVTVVNYGDSRDAYTEIPDRSDEADAELTWIYDQRASVSFAARSFRLRDGEVTHDAWHHIDRVEGLQIHITNPDGSRTYAGMYFQAGRLYIIEATGPAESILTQTLFQQSLYFLDDEGVRVRYELRPDGSRARVALP